MSVLTPLPLAQAQANDLSPRWITPEEQLYQLALPAARNLVDKNSQVQLIDLNSLIVDRVARCMVRSITKSKIPIPSLTELCVKQLLNPDPLPTHLTNWYTALRQIGALPEKIPPLPGHIGQIMEGKCPIYNDPTQPNGNPLKVGDTHVLSLVPREFGTLNNLECSILKPYGRRKYSNKEHPLQFRASWEEALQEHAKTPFSDTHWVLMTKTVLPNSRNKKWSEQAELVGKISRGIFIDYKIPTLQQFFVATTTHMVATGERCYEASNTQSGNTSTYTRVQDTTQGYNLVIGGCKASGMRVAEREAAPHEGIGIAALRKL